MTADPWFWFVAGALATWRMASLLVNEDGPGAVFARIRRRAGVEAIVIREPDGSLNAGKASLTALGEGLTCVWCVSVWAAGLLIVTYALAQLWRPLWVLWQMGVLWLAWSAAAILGHELIERVRR